MGKLKKINELQMQIYALIAESLSTLQAADTSQTLVNYKCYFWLVFSNTIVGH